MNEFIKTDAPQFSLNVFATWCDSIGKGWNLFDSPRTNSKRLEIVASVVKCLSALKMLMSDIV